MLARMGLKDTALSAQMLGIAEWERDGLIAFVEATEAGTIVHWRCKIRPIVNWLFNMREACEDNECGTVCCIGGFVGLWSGMSPEKATRYVSGASAPLNGLYYPYLAHHQWSRITPKRASEVVRDYLINGVIRWPSRQVAS